MRKFNIFIIIGVLLLASPALHAQDFLQKAKNYLDAGNCEKAQMAYEAYKVEHPSGNADVEKRIAECRTPAQTPGNNKTDQTFKVGDVTFKMIFVEGGTFQMGATSEQGSDAEKDEKPNHDVTLSDFYIGETEVTQSLWKAVMEWEPTYYGGWTDEYGRGATYPAYRVSWEECVQFCNELNSKLSRELPPGYKFALPTEAQWEYAARGGNRKSSYKYAGGGSIDEVAWYKENSGGKTHPVMGKRANALNIYDMSGNVWEWCEDWYSSSWYSDNRNWTDPVNTNVTSIHMLRGGSWSCKASRCRVAIRGDFTPSYRGNYSGFRLALVRR
jgi:formylglycine-generating enzyme required for sulfatase activity